MSIRYLLQREQETIPSLLVQVVDVVNDDVVSRVRNDMFDMGCITALVLDEQRAVILQDTFEDQGAESIHPVAEIPTQELLPEEHAGVLPFLMRVEYWLRSMLENWRGTLPKEPWADILRYHVVPALLEAQIEYVDIHAA